MRLIDVIKICKVEKNRKHIQSYSFTIRKEV